MARTECEDGGCPVDFVLRQISGPWTTHILWLLRTHGILRFGELKKLLPDISPKMLTDRLKRLEADGLVLRIAHDVVPPHVDYRLTPLGVEAAEKVRLLADWIETSLPQIAAGWTDRAA